MGAISSNTGKHCGIIKNRLHFKRKDKANNPGPDDIKKFLKYEEEYKNKEHHIYKIGVFEEDKKAIPWYKPGGIKILNENGKLVNLEVKSKLIESLMMNERKMMALYLPRPEEGRYGQRIE